MAPRVSLPDWIDGIVWILEARNPAPGVGPGFREGPDRPYKQGVSGSNPDLPTKSRYTSHFSRVKHLTQGRPETMSLSVSL